MNTQTPDDTGLTDLIEQYAQTARQLESSDSPSRRALQRQQGQIRQAVLKELPQASAALLLSRADILNSMANDIQNRLRNDLRFLKPLRIISPQAFKAWIEAEAKRLYQLSIDSSIQRLRSAQRMLAILETATPDIDDAMASTFFPIARRLFRDENTRVWRTGAYCMGLLFQHQEARDLFDALLPGALALHPSIHARRHALAALGHIARLNPEYARVKAGALFKSLPNESPQQFNRRRDVWQEASFVFALSGFFQTDPDAALTYFRQLANYPVDEGDHYSIHNTLVTFVTEILPDLIRGCLRNVTRAEEWDASIREWHQSISHYFNRESEPANIWVRHRHRTQLNKEAFSVMDAALNQMQASSQATPAPPCFDELDHFAQNISTLCEHIQNRKIDILQRVDTFGDVTNRILRFFDVDGCSWRVHQPSCATPAIRDLDIRWQQLASNASESIASIIKTAQDKLESSNEQEFNEVRVYLIYGIRLLTTLYDALPTPRERDAIQNSLFDLLRSDDLQAVIEGDSGSFNLVLKYTAVVVERLLDSIWCNTTQPEHDGRSRCLRVHKLTEDVAGLPGAETILKNALKLAREDQAGSCLWHSCLLLLPNSDFEDSFPHCGLCNGKWKPASSLLPVLSRINGILTNTAESESHGAGFNGILEKLALEFEFAPDIMNNYAIWQRLLYEAGPRHLLRDSWNEATPAERSSTCKCLENILAACFHKLTGSYGMPVCKALNLNLIASNLARAMLTPAGSHTISSESRQYRGATLLGVLQAPASHPAGTDQLHYLTCYRSLDEGHNQALKGILPWTKGVRIDTLEALKRRNMLHIEFQTANQARRPPLSLPWYLIIGLIQALSQDQTWHDVFEVKVARDWHQGTREYRIVVYPANGIWHIPDNGPLRTGQLVYDNGSHKVSFWLHWINWLLGNGKQCWQVVEHQTKNGQETAALCIRLHLPEVKGGR